MLGGPTRSMRMVTAAPLVGGYTIWPTVKSWRLLVIKGDNHEIIEFGSRLFAIHGRVNNGMRIMYIMLNTKYIQ
jgi:hypothetical protein